MFTKLNQYHQFFILTKGLDNQGFSVSRGVTKPVFTSVLEPFLHAMMETLKKTPRTVQKDGIQAQNAESIVHILYHLFS